MVSDVPVVSKPYLWHLRLGHISDNKLHALHHFLSELIDFHSNKDYIVCPIAKHKMPLIL